MVPRLFSNRIQFILDELGCSATGNQEHKLRLNRADFQFSVRKGDYDKGYMKLVIIQGFADEGYQNVAFVLTPEDRQMSRDSNVYDYFTAKVSYI